MSNYRKHYIVIAIVLIFVALLTIGYSVFGDSLGITIQLLILDLKLTQE